MDLLQAPRALVTGLNALKLTGNAAIQTAIADLSLAAARAMSELAAEVRKNAELQEQNRVLGERLALREEMVFEENVYWRRAGGGSRQGPFCPGCYGDHGKLIPMQAHRSRWHVDYYECPSCQNRTDDPHGTPTENPNDHLTPVQDY